MKVLYIGYVVSRKMADEMPAVSAAGNNFQLGMLTEMQAYFPLEIYTVFPKAAWPTEKEIVVRSQDYALEKDLQFRSIPYINIRLLKELSTMWATARVIRKFCNENKGEDIYVISYNGNGPISRPILRLRKKYGYRYMCIVVDPPLYQGTTTRSGLLYKVLYNMLARSFEKAAKQCDDCVVLNGFYAQHCLKRDDFHVLDCGVAEQHILQRAEDGAAVPSYWEADGKRHIVFSGILHEHSGILRFTQMFLQLSPENFVLHIFGKGNYEDRLRELAKDTDRVRLHGFISNKDIIRVQRKADYLVCPNMIEHPINKVSFPSKIQEYMLSGVPVIATMINGISQDYYEHLYMYDDTLEGLKQVFDVLVSQDAVARKEKAEGAARFVLCHKTWKHQVDKLVRFIQERIKEKG